MMSVSRIPIVCRHLAVRQLRTLSTPRTVIAGSQLPTSIGSQRMATWTERLKRWRSQDSQKVRFYIKLKARLNMTGI